MDWVFWVEAGLGNEELFWVQDKTRGTQLRLLGGKEAS